MATCGVSFTGELVAAPQVNTGTNGGLPTAVSSVSLALLSGTLPKGQTAWTGPSVRYMDSAGAFEDLDAAGPGTAVPQGEVLYARCTSPMLLRLTTKAGADPDLLSVLPLKGPVLIEFDPDRPLVLLEAQGVGDIEFFVSGRRA